MRIHWICYTADTFQLLAPKKKKYSNLPFLRPRESIVEYWDGKNGEFHLLILFLLKNLLNCGFGWIDNSTTGARQSAAVDSTQFSIPEKPDHSFYALVVYGARLLFILQLWNVFPLSLMPTSCENRKFSHPPSTRKEPKESGRKYKFMIL